MRKDFDKFLAELPTKYFHQGGRRVDGREGLEPGPLTFAWETGGSDGGNCWGGTSREYTETNREPAQFRANLDAILMRFAPRMPYQEYRDLEAAIERGSFTNHEYYRNRQDFDFVHLDADMLWGFVKSAIARGSAT